MRYAVILAGGVGSRFWPQSRQAYPKQFLTVTGTRSLLQGTVDRLAGYIPPERTFVVTHTRYFDETRRQLPEVPEANILAEPLSRNTAPAIAFAAAYLAARDPDASFAVLPADHVILNVARFHEVLETAFSQAEGNADSLVTIGVAPSHPETGYGYLQFEGTSEDTFAETPRACPVLTFAEKPDLATAERFVDSGDFLWNAGMFVWRADTLLAAVAQHLPELASAMQPFQLDPAAAHDVERIEEAFAASPKQSIDYGVMERASNVFVVPAAFGWSDVGDWRAVYGLQSRDAQGNAVQGEVILQDASRCFVAGRDRLVVVVGLNDVVVVDTEDALLVLNRESAQSVKNVVDYLNANGLEQYV